MIPTLFGIMVLNFAIVQFAPGGPVERIMAQLEGHDVGATARIAGTATGEVGQAADSRYRGSRGIRDELLKQLEQEYGFDRPAHERFGLMIWNYLRLDFGESFYSNRTVIELIREKLPVSISLGLWTTLLVYLISIPLGIKKAVRDGSRFDFWTSAVVIVGNAVPSFLFAVLLVILFAGGSFLD